MNSRDEGLLISLIGGVEIAAEEVDNVRMQVFSLAKRHGLLVEVPEPREPTEMHVDTFPKRQRQWSTVRAAVLLLVGFLASHLVQVASAERDWLADGPPVPRIVKTGGGHFYAVTITRAKPGHPYTEWVTQREISEDEVAKMR